MSDAKPVFVADSCIGGLSVLRSLWDSGYASEAVFLADYRINPLGVKDDDTIADVVESWMTIASEHSDTLIMACNTLSVRYHHLLQSGATLPEVARVISMVDCFKAMVRSEAGSLIDKKVLVVGTRYTASQNVYRDILAARVSGVSVAMIAATELERQIARIEPWIGDDYSVFTSDLRHALLNTDVAVLACTCFPIVTAKLQALFPNVLFLDPGQYCSDYLEATSDDCARTLQMKVTGDVVPSTQAADFARSYLQAGIGGVVCCN